MTHFPDLLDEPERLPRRGGFNLASLLVLAGILVTALIVGLALDRQRQSQPQSGPAPAFSLTTFDGQPIALDALRGNVVVVNFWASWCIPCKEEAPALEAVWQRYRDQGVVVLGVAYADVDSDSLRFIDEFNLTYPNAPDSGTRISDAYHITGVPETFIIDQQGNIAQFFFVKVTEASLSEALDRLLDV